MTTFSLANRKKSTPRFWKRVGRALVVAMGVVTTSVAAVPLPIWPKLGIIVLANGVLYLGNWMTTLTHDPNEVVK